MQSNVGPFNLASTFVRLRSDVSIETLPVDDAFWKKMAVGDLGTFHNEYLGATYSFDADWPMWEMHPNGDEMVFLLSGSSHFILEMADGPKSFALTQAGSYVIVPKGIWHTARATAPCRMLFITAGEATHHREA